MRLGTEVLEADLYGVLGVLPDATDSEIRVAYRRQARVSHPDLNQHDPEATLRMKQLNLAARVLLDRALRRTYDRRARTGQRASARPPARQAAWYERREQQGGEAWSSAPPAAAREYRSHFAQFFGELRGREGKLSLQFQELLESLSARQQLGVAALLFVAALGLLSMSRPHALVTDSADAASVSVGAIP